VRPAEAEREARERIEIAVDRMTPELLGTATGAESEAVKLNAIRDALVGAGLGAQTEVSVEVEPWEQLMAMSPASQRFPRPSIAPSKVDYS
jgi:hypothetical protein